MKKFLFSVLAVGSIVACTKSEVKYAGETEIAFAPVTSAATKANVLGAIDGTAYPTDETFYVWGYWQDCPAGSDNSTFTDPKTYINGQAFKYAHCCQEAVFLACLMHAAALGIRNGYIVALV